MIEFDIIFEKHCKNCIHNEFDHWCNVYDCNPFKALSICKTFNFELEKEKED
ncbi:hypothetical protein [Floccifex sp.]|uniref:hypothetical protein n=1 Tax=Floccifex sp. TaxID=2815810 RepID=UPI003F0E1846